MLGSQNWVAKLKATWIQLVYCTIHNDCVCSDLGGKKTIKKSRGLHAKHGGQNALGDMSCMCCVFCRELEVNCKANIIKSSQASRLHCAFSDCCEATSHSQFLPTIPLVSVVSQCKSGVDFVVIKSSSVCLNSLKFLKGLKKQIRMPLCSART